MVTVVTVILWHVEPEFHEHDETYYVFRLCMEEWSVISDKEFSFKNFLRQESQNVMVCSRTIITNYTLQNTGNFTFGFRRKIAFTCY